MNSYTEEIQDPLKSNSVQISTEKESEIEDSESNVNPSGKEDNPPIKEMTNTTVFNYYIILNIASPSIAEK